MERAERKQIQGRHQVYLTVSSVHKIETKTIEHVYECS